MKNPTLTAVPGVRAGHWTHPGGETGVTVALFLEGAIAGGFVPGHAPGSRELGLLDPTHLAGRVHGFCFAGGSAFGLAAADGVMAWLAEQGVGFPTSVAPVPLVPAAILFDLKEGRPRPDRDAGYTAAAGASDAPLPTGRVGAGAGATVASVTGVPRPGGLGSVAAPVGAWTVGAAVAVNAFGAVRDPDTGAWVAGDDTWEAAVLPAFHGNTTLAMVATDAPLDRAQANVVARMAAAGFARTLYPAYAPFDGDTVFVASTGRGEPLDPIMLSLVGHAAARCVARAIVEAVQ